MELFHDGDNEIMMNDGGCSTLMMMMQRMTRVGGCNNLMMMMTFVFTDVELPKGKK